MILISLFIIVFLVNGSYQSIINETETEIVDDYENRHFENLNNDTSNEIVTNFHVIFPENLFNDDSFPAHFNCSFNAFDNEFSFTFKYRSYAFSENTPVYMWNGVLMEKRIAGKQHAHYSVDDQKAFAALMKDTQYDETPFLVITFFDSAGTAFDFMPEVPSKEDPADFQNLNVSPNNEDNDDDYDYELNARRWLSRHKRSTRRKLNYKLTRSMKLDLNVVSDAKKMSKRSKDILEDPETKEKPKIPTNLWIDMIAVADYSYFTFFNEHSAWYEVDSLPSKEQVTYLVETYIAHVVNGIAMRFTENLKNDNEMRININLMAIIVTTTNEGSPWSDVSESGVAYDPRIVKMAEENDFEISNEHRDNLSIQLTLAKFRKFMKKNFTKTNGFPTFDYAIGFTRKGTYDAAKDEDGKFTLARNVGYSYQKLTLKNEPIKRFEKPIIAICNDYGYSIIGLNGSLQIIIIATHEIIHALGVYHDGDPRNPLASACSDGVYMLATVVGKLESHKSWYFSRCTLAQLKFNLLDEARENRISTHAKCLEDKIRVFNGLPKLNETYPGQRYSSTMQCKFWLGVHATLCLNYLTDICTSLICKQHKDAYMCQTTSLGAAEGTPCGKGKWCQNGKCIQHPQAPKECIWGDIIPACYTISKFHREGNYSFDPYERCTTEFYKKNCCETCKMYNITNRKTTKTTTKVTTITTTNTKLQVINTTLMINQTFDIINTNDTLNESSVFYEEFNVTRFDNKLSSINNGSDQSFIDYEIKSNYSDIENMKRNIKNDCKPPWVPHDYYCLYGFNYTMPWEEADRACRSLNGYLLYIINENEWHSTKYFIRQYSRIQLGKNKTVSVWLGARQINYVWRWSHNDEKIIYTKWRPQSPPNFDIQPCAYAAAQIMNWQKWDCDTEFYTVCRKY